MIPARTDTAWWQGYVPWASQVVFIKGRLVYGSEQAWIDRHHENILKPKATVKQLNALVRKIGGALLSDEAIDKLDAHWRTVRDYKKLPWTFDAWLGLDHLKRESAPFP
ncbi:hypothetical protein KC887_07950, partial [Candidatus Kaiserbacteria bacterium]|nr:hypothetical protein [Candidatus Kaiserbacteria bacterium]